MRARVHTVCLLTLLLPAGCARGPQRHDETFFAMNAAVEITLVTASTSRAQAALQAARAEVERLESLLSDYRPESNVSRLNDRTTDIPAPETRFLMERAQQVCRETGGAFDISLGPMKRLWGFGSDENPHVPAPEEIASVLQHVGCEMYALAPDGRVVWLDTQARIDLGGIAQGYVAACLADTFGARGIERFLITISGDIAVAGERPDGGPWRVGVQNPRQPDSLLASVPMQWAAVTTSGDYEQFFVEKGVRYHHVFDPATGYPARGAASVSVWSNDPVAADAYATALFVLGPERGLAFVDSRPDLAALFVVEGTDGGLSLRRSAALAAAAAHGAVAQERGTKEFQLN